MSLNDDQPLIPNRHAQDLPLAVRQQRYAERGRALIRFPLMLFGLVRLWLLFVC